MISICTTQLTFNFLVADPNDTDKIIEVESSQPPRSNPNMVRDHTYTQDVQSPEQGPDLVDDRQKEETNKAKTKSMLADNLSGKSSSASSSEDEDQFRRVDRDAILKSLSSPVSRNICINRDSRSDMEYDFSNSSPSMLYKDKMEGRFFFADKPLGHTPTHSLASDLQVEASEIGSPPLTVDASIASYDEEVQIYEGSMAVEITSSSEDISATSCHRYGGVDENESRLRDIHKVRENETVEVSSNLSSDDPIAIHKLGETIEESPNPLTQLNSNAELPDGSPDHISGCNFKSEENYQMSNISDSLHATTRETLTFPVDGEAQQLTGEVMAQHSQNSVSGNPKVRHFFFFFPSL